VKKTSATSRRWNAWSEHQQNADFSIEPMAPKTSDRELIALSKTHTLQAVANKLQRSPAAILKKPVKLGLSIKHTAKTK
jgi:hypothetical protein